MSGREEKAMAAMAAVFMILLQERLDMPELVWKRFIDLEVLHWVRHGGECRAVKMMISITHFVCCVGKT